MSNSEIAEGYMDRQDPAVTVKLRLQSKNEKLKHDKEKYEITDDGFIKTVVALIRKDSKVLMTYDIRHGTWFLPG